MSVEEKTSVIKDKINLCLDFLKYSTELLSSDNTLFDDLYGLKNRLNRSEIENNLYIQDDILNRFDKILNKIEKIDANFSRNPDGTFDTQFIDNSQQDIFNNLFDELYSMVSSVHKVIDSFLNIVDQKKENEKIRSEYKKSSDENIILKSENKLLLNTVSNKKVTDLYAGVESECKKYFRRYRFLFLFSIFMTLLLAIAFDPLKGVSANFVDMINAFFRFDHKSEITEGEKLVFNFNILKFILFKISIVLVGVTLTTYFLKLSVYYQGKFEQAKQTRLELEAFPDYISLVSKETAEELRKDLALKYFGKELDKSYNEKIGNLIQDQVSSSVDLVKATAEIIKSANPASKNSESEKKVS